MKISIPPKILCERAFVGAGLARDAGAAMRLQYRDDAIAAVRRSDKPAPQKLALTEICVD